MAIKRNNSSSQNEQYVREDIIAPLLKQLGYRVGSRHGIKRELTLKYGKLPLGRKKPKSDPELKGRADYVLMAGGTVFWVLEAKSPLDGITDEDVGQAWTYAVHPEVRAVYFCLCDGVRIKIYRTEHGSDVGPVFDHPVADCITAGIGKILEPDELLARFQDVYHGEPIAYGLGSVAKVVQGWIRYEEPEGEGNAAFGDLQFSIVNGHISRDDKGLLVVNCETLAPSTKLQKLNETLGLNTMALQSVATTLSKDPLLPTAFAYLNDVVLPEGLPIFDIRSWSESSPLAFDIPYHVESVAAGVLDGRVFSGRFRTKISFFDKELDVLGRFSVTLS